MKVLDLGCELGHVFEGWFGSEDDYLDQRARGLLTCPMCASSAVSKRLSAPRLNLGAPNQELGSSVAESKQASQRAQGNAPSAPTGDASTAPATAEQQSLQSAMLAAAAADPAFAKAWMSMAKRVMANTTDVGDKFTEEARKMHYGETQERGIRGHATAQQALELQEEGISVMPLPLPDALKGPLQ
jgi:hypothetical protein